MNKDYFSTDSKTLVNLSAENVSNMYSKGYVFTRLGKGVMNQTRSLRIDLEEFELNSENRRVLRKTEYLTLISHNLPLENYSWKIHKLGKEYYTQKFGRGTMSASKIKDMFTDTKENNMNLVLEFYRKLNGGDPEAMGYCLCYENSDIIHYAYPFYNLFMEIPNTGLGMMTKAIVWAKEQGKKYVYLGSVTDEASKYKLQFKGLEWFDTETQHWKVDIDQLKKKITE